VEDTGNQIRDTTKNLLASSGLEGGEGTKTDRRALEEGGASNL